MTKHLLASTGILTILATGSLAQDIIDLGEIVISAGEAPVEEDRTGVTVEVLEEEDITDAPDTRVLETLGHVPGVTVTGNGGIGTTGFVSIRGLPARYVSTRINGIDVSDPSSVQTQYNIGALTSAGLGRIEVLKGSQSAIYGSEAIGGVLDIRTFRLEEEGTELRFGVEYGSFDTFRGDFTVASKSGAYDVSFTLSHLRTDGFSAADENEGNTEADDYQGTTAYLSAGYQATEALRFGVDLIYQNDDFNIDAFGGAGGDADRPNTSDQRGIRANATYETNAVFHELAVSYFDIDRRDPLGFSPVFQANRTELKYDGRVDVGATKFVFGAEYSEEEATFSNGTFSYDSFAVFGEVQYAVTNALDVSAALRFDDHSEFGSATTGRLAAAWRPSDQTVIKASLGTGFRAPSLNELFGPFNSSPPTLEPEESRSFDIGISHDFLNGAEVDATLFYTEIDNLIGFAFPAGYTQTTGTTRSRGLELSGSVPLSDTLTLFGAYTFAEAQNPNGTPIVRVPRHDLVAGLEASLTDRLSGQVVVNHVAGLPGDGFPSRPMPDFTVVDMQIDYAVSDSASVYLRVENLFDKEYQRVAGFGTSDRAVYVGLRAAF